MHVMRAEVMVAGNRPGNRSQQIILDETVIMILSVILTSGSDKYQWRQESNVGGCHHVK